MTDVVNPTSPETTEVNGTQLGPTGRPVQAWALTRCVTRCPITCCIRSRAHPRFSPPEALLPRARAGSARPHAAALDGHHADLSGPVPKVACYLSAEFLMGPHLGNNLLNLGSRNRAAGDGRAGPGLSTDPAPARTSRPGQRRPRAAGGLLSRLAGHAGGPVRSATASATSSASSDQEIRDGWQVEKTDKWLRLGNPWEIRGRSRQYQVKLRVAAPSSTRTRGQAAGALDARQRGAKGVAYDTPIQGYRRQHGNTLRCGRRRRPESFDFWTPSTAATTTGPSTRRWCPRPSARCLSRTTNRESRASDCGWSSSTSSCRCSLQDMIRIHLQRAGAADHAFPDKFAIQLNDTHPVDRRRRADAAAGRRAPS